MLLMIDNYDSFTYNLVQYLGELGAEVEVYRNDAIALDQIEALAPTHIVVSPGPCTPNEAGISVPLIEKFAGRVPDPRRLSRAPGIGQAFGGRVVHAQRLMHGKVSAISHGGKGVFAGLPDRFSATRYHSLAIERTSLPDCLEDHRRDRRRRNHGRAAPGARGRGRAIPSGIDPHRAWPPPARQFPDIQVDAPCSTEQDALSRRRSSTARFFTTRCST